MDQAWDTGKALQRLQQHSAVSSRASGKAKCERDWNWKPPPLPDFDLWYVVSGVGTIQINGQRYAAAAGCCFLLQQGDLIYAEHDPEQRLTVIFIHYRFEPIGASQADADTAAPLAEWPRLVQIRDTAWLELLLNRLLTLDDEKHDSVNAAEFDAVMKAVLCISVRDSIQLPADNSLGHAAVRKAIRLIKENAAAPPDHETLAAYTGLSPRYLNVLFKMQTGVSVKTYLARARIERACMLLAESTMNVSQIAETMGYSDIYFFSKQFKQFVGESPLRYRARTYDARSTQALRASAYDSDTRPD